MKKISIILMVLLSGISFGVSAQFGITNRIKLVSGDFAFLKGATELNILFNYDDMSVGTMTEKDYMEKHSSEMNQKKAGSGDEWKKKWADDRNVKFEPSFLKTFAKRLTKIKIVADAGKTSAKYTLIIKTVKTEPGVYTGISYAEKDSYIDVRALFVETENPDVILAEVSGGYIKGKETFDVSARLSYSYLSLGNLLGGFVVSKVKSIK